LSAKQRVLLLLLLLLLVVALLLAVQHQIMLPQQLQQQQVLTGASCKTQLSSHCLRVCIAAGTLPLLQQQRLLRWQQVDRRLRQQPRLLQLQQHLKTNRYVRWHHFQRLKFISLRHAP
jgi:biopolymer transport protein ExbD